jgi:hypothetical protein
VKVYVWWDCANFRPESGDLVCKHARRRSLDGVIPVVVVVTQRISEVQDSHLADVRRVFSYVEVGRLDTALSHWMRNKEEIELAVNDLRLFYEALIDVGALGRIVDKLLAVVHGLLEESLADSLIYNNKSDLGWGVLRLAWLVSSLTGVCEKTVFVLANLIQLLKLKVYDLLAHRVTDTIAVYEDVVRHLPVVELSVALERPLEVIRKDGGGNDLLALLRLGACLSVVLAQKGIIGSAETNCTLFSFVTDVNSD